jgi:squalene-hopene/tetraprenyl-beta-curcumene cyclase
MEPSEPSEPLMMAPAIAAAKSYLLAQAREEFPETAHVLFFPRRAGFRVKRERQASDVFARSVLASVLLDAADLDEDPSFRRAIEEIARREAAHVAAAKLTDRAGGWSYFPDLPELPPDLDSLSAALLLFQRASPDNLALGEEPVRLALESARADGAIETWLISPRDDPGLKRAMRRGVAKFWGNRIDLDVCAHFYYALWSCDRKRHGDIVRRGACYLAAEQEASGSWEASWYHGRAYGVGLCLRLLRAVGTDDESARRAVEFLRREQRPDGGWAVWETDAQETALTLWAMGESTPTPVLERAVASILDYQTREGHWKASPWIEMNAGRAHGRPGPSLTYSSATLTAAFCLRALLWARRELLKRASSAPPSVRGD